MHVLLCSTLCMFSSVLYMWIYKSWDVLYGLVSCELRILLLLPRTTRVGQSARIDRHDDYSRAVELHYSEMIRHAWKLL